MIVVGTQRQFPRTGIPIDGVSEAQLHAVGTRQMTIPVALHTGVKDQILLLVRIAHHSLMGDVRAVSARIESLWHHRYCLVNQEVIDLGHEETAGEQCLNEMAPRLVAHAGQIGVVVALMRPRALVF